MARPGRGGGGGGGGGGGNGGGGSGSPGGRPVCSELQPLLRLPPGLRPSSPEGPESAAGGTGCTTGGSAARFTGGPPRLAP